MLVNASALRTGDRVEIGEPLTERIVMMTVTSQNLTGTIDPDSGTTLDGPDGGTVTHYTGEIAAAETVMVFFEDAEPVTLAPAEQVNRLAAGVGA